MKRQGDFNRNKTHCPQKHKYTEANTYVNPGGRRWCRECMRANSRRQVIRKYGISVEEFQELLIKQDYKCAICERDLYTWSENGELNIRDIQIDHDHDCCKVPNRSCGKCIRGILCGECNRGLARFRDSVKLLRTAASYLEKYELPPTGVEPV